MVNLFAARVSATKDRNLVGKESLVLVKEFTPKARYLGEKEVVAYHRLLALSDTLSKSKADEEDAQAEKEKSDEEDKPVDGECSL